MNIALVGATGLVGSVMLKVLEERNFPVNKLIPVASEKSIGRKIMFKGKECVIQCIESALLQHCDIAVFSAGSKVSLLYAPRFAQKGCFVIDNSSAWRMNKEIKLIVPEINASQLTASDKIIANPNCSTIQLVMALYPLHKKYGIKRLVISTYQSVTGTGVNAVKQLENERAGIKGPQAYPYEIDLNCFPHAGDFIENGYTSEEMKLVNESRKILCDDKIDITATVVRIPVIGGHSESVNITLKKEFNITEIIDDLYKMPGLVVLDDPQNNLYPMPKFCKDKDEVFVGRIRRDFSFQNSLNMWIVADNLRKGAATNAIQIAEYLTKNFLSGKNYGFSEIGS